jgi:hypothetical protein
MDRLPQEIYDDIAGYFNDTVDGNRNLPVNRPALAIQRSGNERSRDRASAKST